MQLILICSGLILPFRLKPVHSCSMFVDQHVGLNSFHSTSTTFLPVDQQKILVEQRMKTIDRKNIPNIYNTWLDT